MRILVTGADGMLGRDLCPTLAIRHEVVPVDVHDADIRQLEAVRRVVRDARPDLVLHAAAFTDVDRAEAEPERASAINAHGTLNVLLAASDAGARMAYISTDYVFDGMKIQPYTEDDTPNPLNVYGHTKLAGERVVRGAAADWYIFRTSWLFASHGRNFVNTMLRLAEDTDRLRVVDDQVGTPTYTLDLARAISAVLAHGHPGIYHVANAQPCTWHEFACEIVHQAHLPATVEPVTTEAFGRPARRPAYSPLATDNLREEVGCHMRPWHHALQHCLARRAEQAALGTRRLALIETPGR